MFSCLLYPCFLLICKLNIIWDKQNLITCWSISRNALFSLCLCVCSRKYYSVCLDACALIFLVLVSFHCGCLSSVKVEWRTIDYTYFRWFVCFITSIGVGLKFHQLGQLTLRKYMSFSNSFLGQRSNLSSLILITQRCYIVFP